MRGEANVEGKVRKQPTLRQRMGRDVEQLAYPEVHTGQLPLVFFRCRRMKITACRRCLLLTFALLWVRVCICV
jgi:hypothetical protein